MTTMTWTAVGERFYEVGVDRGVLYIDDVGVAWTGLVSVSESPVGGEAKAYYIDGIKYLNLAAREEFEATIEAYTYPDEFAQCDGSNSISNGLSFTQQKRKSFGLAYRSNVGNDIDGVDHAYKLHLVYGALAAPSQNVHATISENIDPYNFSWKITTKPEILQDHRPTSHFIIDSRETPVALLAFIENILYGEDLVAARLPTVLELTYLFFLFENSLLEGGIPDSQAPFGYDGGFITSIQESFIDGGGPGEGDPFIDAGLPTEPPYYFYSGGDLPTSVQTATFDGGTL
jgi:hypothetical protein